MRSFVNPILITVGAWAILFLVLKFLARYILLIKKLTLQIGLVTGFAGLLFLYYHSPVTLSPEWEDVLTTALAIAVIWGVLKSLGFFFFGYVLRDREEVIIPPLIRKLIMLAVYLIAVVLILKAYYPDLNLTGLLVGSTVFSAIVGLALQDILINFLSGVALSIEKPFRLNNWVRVGGQEGVVTEISWRSTKVRTRENNLVIVPNSVIAKELIINYDQPSPLHRQTVRIGVSYQTPPPRVRQALLEAAKQVPIIIDNPSPEVHLIDYDAYTINYELRYWLADYESAPNAANQIRTQIYDAFRKNNIRIPFPIRDIFLHRERKETTREKRLQLVVLAGWQTGTCIEIGDQEITLGRETGNTFQIKDPQVSKKHARITRTEEGVVLEDLESKTGTRVNNVPARRRRLRDGDEILIGSTRLLFEEV